MRIQIHILTQAAKRYKAMTVKGLVFMWIWSINKFSAKNNNMIIQVGETPTL